MIWQKRDPYWEIEANASVKRMASDLTGCTRCLVLELNWSAILSRFTLQKAASPASCLISLTVCTEAVMLSSRLPQSANGGSP